MIVTARLPRRRARLCLGVAAAALLCCGALTILLGRGMVPASGSAQPSPKGIKSNEDRVAYLQAWGWPCNPHRALIWKNAPESV